MKKFNCLKPDLFDFSCFPHCSSHCIFKPLASFCLVKQEVKIKVIWNPMGTQIQNPSGSSFAVVLGTEVCRSNLHDDYSGVESSAGIV